MFLEQHPHVHFNRSHENQDAIADAGRHVEPKGLSLCTFLIVKELK